MCRNQTQPNPSTNLLPSYLMAVGPPGFTAFAFLNLGQAAVEAFPSNNTILGGAEAGRVFLYVSVWWAFMLYVRPSSATRLREGETDHPFFRFNEQGMCLWLFFSPICILIVSACKKRDLVRPSPSAPSSTRPAY